MLDHLADLKRTHTCGELTLDQVGTSVTLLGWVAKRRDLGSIIFIDIRDRWGLTQLVFTPEHQEAIMAKAKLLRSEFVIAIKGQVKKRDSDTVNNKITTGEIEIYVDELSILNHAETPPFPIVDQLQGVGEELRLKHRYLDLRRPVMQKNFILRHQVAFAVRRFLNAHNFLELETPKKTSR